jgi:hypothetical protein
MWSGLDEGPKRLLRNSEYIASPESAASKETT